jgi:hypothetical protein
VLIVHGRFIVSDEEFYLFNIYAQCDNGDKLVLWNSLSVHLQRMVGKNIVCAVILMRSEVWRKEGRGGLLSVL